MKKPILIISVLAVAIVALVGVKSVVANSLSTSGVALGSTQDEIKILKKENAILQEEILKYSSLQYISSSAAKLGFSKSKSNFALKKANPIALSR